MSLNIRPSTSQERKLIFLEALLNGTNKVSKIGAGSVLDGVADGIAKVAGKAEKDVMLAVSQLFPDTAFDEQLDASAENFGIAPRFEDLGSSTYVRLTAAPGTIYVASTHVPSSTDGIIFQFANNVTIGTMGFAYALVNSVSTGENTNVDPLTISKLSPAPAGHLNIVNEYKATGGRDVEDDQTFRVRQKDGANILAKGILSMLEQLFMAINPKVLRVFHQGTSITGKVILTIATQNGSSLSNTELSNLLSGASEFFSLTEYSPFGTSFYGIELRNATNKYIDMSFRCELMDDADPDQVRKDIQVAASKYIDPRFFNASTDAVEWINLYEIVKNTNGMKNLPDQYFYPRTDLAIDTYQLPRMRSFLMCNLDGTVISNLTGTLSPVFYPNIIDDSYIATILGL